MHLNWKRPKIFYGWWIVGACFFVATAVGIIFYGFTAIFEPIANEFGWSYAQISLAASLRGLEAGLLAPLIGVLVDRWGPRRLVFIGAVILGLGLILLSRVTSLGMFYGTFLFIAIGTSTCASTVLMTAVANWFRSKVGIATGIVMCGYGFSGLTILVIVKLIDMYEWRMAMVIIALGIWAIILPLSLLIRHKPEQYGYLPDGKESSSLIPGEGPSKKETDTVDMSTKQALKSRAFWHISLPLVFQNMMLSAVVTHVMPYLSSVDITRSVAGLVASAIPLISISGRLSFGWAGDKFEKRRVAAGGFTMVSLGMLCFGYVPTGGTWLLVPFLILFGIGYGGMNTLRVTLVREYFGRSSFGTIHGISMGIMMLGTFVGAPLAGWVFDTWANYQPIWIGFAGLAIVAIIIEATMPSVSTTIQLANKPKA